LCVVSPRSEKWQPVREIAETLQPICAIFPFSGDFAQRPFFDLHCAIDVVVFSGLRPVASYEMRHLRRRSLINAGSERRNTCKSSQRGVSHLKIVITVSGADADTADNLSFDDNR
jgi:hypothetical protein